MSTTGDDSDDSELLRSWQSGLIGLSGVTVLLIVVAMVLFIVSLRRAYVCSCTYTHVGSVFCLLWCNIARTTVIIMV